MPDFIATTPQASPREPWNKGKLVGAKPPLRPKHVWSIRTKLQIAGRTRDLAMFNLAIDSKLRGCDVVSLRVEDVAPHGHAVDRATVRHKLTFRPGRATARSSPMLTGCRQNRRIRQVRQSALQRLQRQAHQLAGEAVARVAFVGVNVDTR